jgi:hypothetical protein
MLSDFFHVVLHNFRFKPFFIVPKQEQDLTMNKNRPDFEAKGGGEISLSTDDDESSKLLSISLVGWRRFQSVLDRPFNKWNEMEDVLAAFVPEWNHIERGYLIQHLICFLELKVVMENTFE